MAITPEDEKRYDLKPLPPAAPFPGEKANWLLNLQYELARRRYRAAHPDRVKGEP